MDERTKIALSSYRKLKAAMDKVAELSEVEAALAMTCHTEHYLASLTPIELAHLQRAVTYRTIANLEDTNR
jgi:hypothetical protein